MQNTIVCIASEHKGNEFLEEAQNAGWHVTLRTVDDAGVMDYVRVVTNLAGSRSIDRVRRI